MGVWADAPPRRGGPGKRNRSLTRPWPGRRLHHVSGPGRTRGDGAGRAPAARPRGSLTAPEEHWMRSLSVVPAVLGLALLVPCDALAGGGSSLNPFLYVNEIRIGTSAPCDSLDQLQACAFQPIAVSAHGVFPNPCMRIRRFEIIQPPYASPF